MDVAFTRISMWLWGGKEQEPVASSGSSMSSSFDFGLGFREPESVKFTSSKRAGMRPRRIKRKWQSREERKVDKEYDLVLVPSDGGCLSGSESDDSDWSIGWMEPHAPDFQSGESDGEGSFAVIVQCYARRHGERSEITNKIDESKKYMEEFLSSLQNS